MGGFFWRMVVAFTKKKMPQEVVLKHPRQGDLDRIFNVAEGLLSFPIQEVGITASEIERKPRALGYVHGAVDCLLQRGDFALDDVYVTSGMTALYARLWGTAQSVRVFEATILRSYGNCEFTKGAFEGGNDMLRFLSGDSDVATPGLIEAIRVRAAL